MLKHLSRVHMESTPFRAQPISSDMDEKAVRFELERRACQSLRKVLQLKLQQRRTREELVNQGIIPPLKSSASFHEQKRSLERARTEDYLKRKIQKRPERAELIRMHILEETSSEASAQVQQWQLKRARLADNLNDKISQRPGPMELIHKNILPIHSNIKHVIIDTEFAKASDELSSCDEDSNDSQDSPLPPGTLTLTQARSPVQEPTDSLAKLKTSLSTCAQKMTAENIAKISPPEHNNQKQKKPKDDKPKIKKLKYHEYIPPDQKGDKEAPPKLDSSYAKLLQQQQLFLQLQILSQQHRQQSASHPSTTTTQPDKQTNQEQSNPTSLPLDASAMVTASVNAQTEESNKATCLPSNLDELKVAELKAELKLRGLTVSGTKSDLIERLRAHQASSAGTGSACPQTAGGAKEPGPEGASKASKTAANGSLSLQLSSLAGQAAATQRNSTLQVKSSGDNSSTISLRVLEDSILITGPKEVKNQEAIGETFDQQPASSPQLNLRIKEEQTSPLPVAPCPFSLQPVYSCSVQKDSSKPKVQEEMVDKDLMLQQKDQQIEELKRLLVHNQRLVDMFRTKLERKTREELQHKTETMLLLRVKEEPPDKNSKSEKQPLSAGKLAVTVKQEVIEEGDVQTLTSGPRIHPNLTNGHANQNIRQQQAVHRLLFQQQRRLQNQAAQSHDQREECSDEQQRACLLQEKKKKKSHRQQQRPVLDSQQHHQQIQLKQQALLQQWKVSSQQQSKECQQIQIHCKREQPQSEQKTPQVSAVCPDQKLQHLLSLDLQNNSTPAIVTDSNGNHFLITLTNQITESQENGNTSKHLTLQRLQSSASKLPGQGSAQLPRPDNEANTIMLMGGLQQQSTKDQRRLHQPPQELSQSLCEQNAPSPQTLNKICSNLDFLFSPVSPAASSSDAKDTENEDFLDFILKTGDISRFRPAPDPALDSLHRSSSPPPPPLHPLLSPATAPCLDPAHPAPSAPHKSPGTTERNRAGRLEDFLESTTGKPLLGVEPGGPLTLIDDLHSQMLCTASILDHPPSPMDAMDVDPSTCPEEQGEDGMDWLDLTMEDGHSRKDLPKFATATPPSVFSTDFLDNYDLETAWDSCL